MSRISWRMACGGGAIGCEASWTRGGRCDAGRSREWLATSRYSRRSAPVRQTSPIVAELPDGYRTPLGKWFNDGRELSGGQWQKVALSRAFMRSRADILVLDEPTAAMDAGAEATIYGAHAGSLGVPVAMEPAFCTWLSLGSPAKSA